MAFSRSANYAANRFLLSDSSSTLRHEGSSNNTYVNSSTYSQVARAGGAAGRGRRVSAILSLIFILSPDLS